MTLLHLHFSLAPLSDLYAMNVGSWMLGWRSPALSLELAHDGALLRREEFIDRWRRDLNPALRNACREAFDDLLGEFGYAS